MTVPQAGAAAGPRHPFPKAFGEGDVAALAETLAPDVVLRSPIISTSFEGVEEVTEVLGVVQDTFEDWRVVDELDGGDTLAFSFRARIGRQELQGADIVRLDDEGRVREITVFVRPLAGVAALAAALGGPLARPRGRLRALILSALSAPLAFATRIGDRIVPRLLLGRYRPRY